MEFVYLCLNAWWSSMYIDKVGFFVGSETGTCERVGWRGFLLSVLRTTGRGAADLLDG